MYSKCSHTGAKGDLWVRFVFKGHKAVLFIESTVKMGLKAIKDNPSCTVKHVELLSVWLCLDPSADKSKMIQSQGAVKLSI